MSKSLVNLNEADAFRIRSEIADLQDQLKFKMGLLNEINRTIKYLLEREMAEAEGTEA